MRVDEDYADKLAIAFGVLAVLMSAAFALLQNL